MISEHFFILTFTVATTNNIVRLYSESIKNSCIQAPSAHHLCISTGAPLFWAGVRKLLLASEIDLSPGMVCLCSLEQLRKGASSGLQLSLQRFA